MGRRKIPKHGPPTPLELDGPAMRRMAELTLDRIVDHVETLASQPLHAVKGGKKLAASLREPLPERGEPFERLLRQLFGRAIPASLNTASPGYLAYIPGGGLYQSAIADWIALATNRYAGVWQAAPGLVQLEQNVIDWLCAIVGLPAGSGGVLTTGGSLANLVALVTAREELLSERFQDGVIYASTEVHHSVPKAARIAGFLRENFRTLPVDARMRLRLDELESAITRDRAAGLRPFCVVGSAGTTNTGAVDDLATLARIAKKHGVWLHVDAAYGGFFAMTERGRRVLAGIEHADSVTLDPHKGLFLPYGTGSILVRDRSALRRAHTTQAAYMPPMQTEDELVDFCEHGPELSREARGLRVWLPLKMHGAKAFRDSLDEKLDLAAYAAERLAANPRVEIVAPPELSLLAFRVRTGGGEAEGDAASRAVLAAVNERQRVLLTGAVVAGRFVIRICILSFRTHRDRIDACIEDIEAAIASSNR